MVTGKEEGSCPGSVSPSPNQENMATNSVSTREAADTGPVWSPGVFITPAATTSPKPFDGGLELTSTDHLSRGSVQPVQDGISQAVATYTTSK